MTAIVPAGDLSALDQMDPAVREQAVTQYLAHARDQLTLAVNLSGPAAVAAIKAEIATAAEATKQLGLSKEIQTDAQEMVRRAEFAVRKAVTSAQETGEVRSRESNLTGSPVRSAPSSTSEKRPTPRDFFTTESEYRDANVLADLSPEQFDDVLTEAREEGNLSRPNVVAKAREIARPAPRKPPRKPLVDVAKTRGFALREAADSLVRIFSDDRIRTNEKQVADVLRGHLLYVAETVAAVLDQLP